MRTHPLGTIHPPSISQEDMPIQPEEVEETKGRVDLASANDEIAKHSDSRFLREG